MTLRRVLVNHANVPAKPDGSASFNPASVCSASSGFGALAALKNGHAAVALRVVREGRDALHEIDHRAEPRQRLPGIGDEIAARHRVGAMDIDVGETHAREQVQPLVDVRLPLRRQPAVDVECCWS